MPITSQRTCRAPCHQQRLVFLYPWAYPRAAKEDVLTWWMMPEPGFQKPMPYLAPADDRKSYTSLFVVIACCRSATPPKELFLPPAGHGPRQRMQFPWRPDRRKRISSHGWGKTSAGYPARRQC